LPPVECIEISLWERFKWGPEQTDRLSSRKLRAIFAILEQERVSKDAIDNLGKPDPVRMQQKISTGTRHVPDMSHVPVERRTKIVKKWLGE